MNTQKEILNVLEESDRWMDIYEICYALDSKYPIYDVRENLSQLWAKDFVMRTKVHNEHKYRIKREDRI